MGAKAVFEIVTIPARLKRGPGFFWTPAAFRPLNKTGKLKKGVFYEEI
jgi:hypothetical protein